jgi:hypothetical protein
MGPLISCLQNQAAKYKALDRANEIWTITIPLLG